MDYTNNFNSSFANMIPDYNPQVNDPHQENKVFPPQQTHPEGGHFNVLMSDPMYQPSTTSGGFDNNPLYSDLDTISESQQLIDSNMSPIDLYDTGHLDATMMNPNQGNLFQPQSTIAQTIFNSFEEPKMSHFNSTIVQHTPNNNQLLSHSDILQTNINNASVGPSSVIQHNPSSVMVSHMPANTTLMEPISTNTFYHSNYNPVPVTQNTAPSTVVAIAEANSGSTNVEAKVTNHVESNEALVSADMLSLDADSRMSNSDAHFPNEPQSDPLSNDGSDAVMANDAEGSGSNDAPDENGEAANDLEERSEENGGAQAEELQKCVREGCENTAVINPEWEDEYCSNECCIKHCTTVFNAWVQENLRNSASQNIGVQP